MPISGSTYRLTGILILIILFWSRGFSQDVEQRPVRLMFYNVENLFDIYNDTLTEDADYLPGGVMRWNQTRYNKKINSLYKTIVAAGEWDPPAVVAFCEVENRNVLVNLIYDTYLSRFNYGIVHEESQDRRGIDVCLIYRKDIAHIIDYKYWIPAGFRREEFATRSVLYVKMIIAKDTIHLIVNHWPSRRGGVLAGEDLRMKIAAMVKEKTDSIMVSATGEKIVILGDFNSTPDDQEMKSLISRTDSINFLINLSESLSAKGFGTYRYLGTWEMIDQVLISNQFLTYNKGLTTDAKMLKIFKPDFLLKKDPKYPGNTPFSTYRGYKYQGGFSDHLPVLLDLKLMSPDR
jgi:endonuclease/exonuclease/phosphatase family metal-dependent hydrolase